MLLVYRTHQCYGWWQGLIDKDKNDLRRRGLDTLADHLNELTHSQIVSYGNNQWITYEVQSQGTHGGHQVLLFVFGGDIRPVR